MPPLHRPPAPLRAPIFATAQTGTVPLSATFQTCLDKSGGVAAADCVLQMTAGRARELAGLRP